MKKVIFPILIFGLFLINSTLAQSKVIINFFYGQGCPHCAKAESFLEDLSEKYPTIEIKKYEVYFHPNNLEIFKNFCHKYNFEPKGVPTIFIGNKYFVGFDKSTAREIEDYTKKLIKESREPGGEEATVPGKFSQKLTLTKVLSLASVDAINPCALAVLTLMLLAILTYNPKKRRNVLLAGGAFIFSVFLMYFFYGLIIIKFFQVVQALTSVRLYLYKILGGAAIFLGFLNVKDFIKYRPGGFLTEMPVFLRPKVQKIISGITSPKGAFLVGLFVTLFLLPCTIGPYVIIGGILSFFKILETIPWLLFYNLIFILPMIGIVIIIYLGTAKIEDVSSWREKNIRYLHLIAGLVMLGLGLGMLLGVI